TLVATPRAGVEPLRRYHRLRRRVLGLDTYFPYDFSIPLVEWDRRYNYVSMLEPIVDAVAPLGLDYQARMRRGFRARVRRAPVHAVQLERDAGRRVHAGARDGPLDAHDAVARAAAVRLLG